MRHGQAHVSAPGVPLPIRLHALALLAALLAASPTSFARAAEPPKHIHARLDYRAPASCPGEEVLRAEVGRHLGYDPFTGGGSRLVLVDIEPVLERGGARLAARLTAFGDAGEPPWAKVLDAPADACPALVASAGSVLAFYLDPLIFAERDAPQPGGSPATSPDVDPRAGPRSPSIRAPPSDHPRSFSLALGMGLAVGPAGPAFSTFTEGAYRASFVSIGLDLRVDAPSSAQAPQAAPEGRVSALGVGGALVPCLHRGWLYGCAVLAGGALVFAGSGVDLPRHPVRGYLGAGPRLGVEQLVFPWLAVRAQVEALFMARPLGGALNGVAVPAPSPLASRVNGALGAAIALRF
ncbi:MAG: hypothetical protein U0359_18120 [Byssovorax sp.]